MNTIRKQTCWLLFSGSLIMSLDLLTRHFMHVPESLTDFFKGFGVALMVGAMVLGKQACEKPVARKL